VPQLINDHIFFSPNQIYCMVRRLSSLYLHFAYQPFCNVRNNVPKSRASSSPAFELNFPSNRELHSLIKLQDSFFYMFVN